MRLQVRLVDRRDCYVSVGRGVFGLQDSSNYSSGSICRVVKLTRLDKNRVYVGYTGGVSKNENELEISQKFAESIGLLEGEPLEVELESLVKSKMKIELTVTSLDYYEIVQGLRDKFETTLLNQISVLFDGIRFPAYFSESQFVVFEYASPDDQRCTIIHPDAELIILPPKETKSLKGNKERRGQKDEEVGTSEDEEEELQYIKFRTMELHQGNEYRLLVSRRVFEKCKLQENRLYKINSVKIIDDTEYFDFKGFVSKQQRVQKTKNNEDKIQNSRPTSQSMVIISASDDVEDEKTIIFNDFMQKALQISTKSIISIDLHYELDNIKDNRILSLHDFMSVQNKIKLIFRLIHTKEKKQLSENGRRGVLRDSREELVRDHGHIMAQIISRYLKGQQDVYYTNQIFEINESFYILKIIEIMHDSKETLRMVVLENSASSLQSSLNKSDSFHAIVPTLPSLIIKENLQLAQQITPHVIIVNQQDFFGDFSDDEVLAINRLVKSKISQDPFLSFKPAIFSLLYSTELNKLDYLLTNKETSPQNGKTIQFKKDTTIDTSLICSNGNIKEIAKQDDHQPSKELEGDHKPSHSSNCIGQVICIQGRSQNGKTYVCEYIRQKHKKYHVEYLDMGELQESVLVEYAKNYIHSKIQIACIKAPSVFVCDNTERICKSLDRIDFQQFQLILISEIISKFLKDLIKKYSHSNPQVKFIILTESKDILNSNIPKIIQTQLTLDIANYAKRKQLFGYLSTSCDLVLDVDELASTTENFTLHEFFILAQKLYSQRKEITSQQILAKIHDLSNKSLKSSKNFPKFEHVGGLREVKDIIRETFEVPIKYEFLFKNIPIKLPRGILLYGPPGCGKTYLAKATSNELGLNFFSVKGPEILNKYIGASEQAVRDIFEKAYSVRPSIVFLDEFDAIVPRRNSGSTAVTDRVVNQFLCYLDGVASLEGVCILAASSRPDLIDPALLRPGRIDRHVYLGIPDEEERRQIFQIYGKNLKMGDNLCVDDLVRVTANFTSSDLVAFLKEIRIKMAHDMIEEKKQNENFEFNFTLTQPFFEKTFKSFRPSLNLKDVKKFEAMYRQFSDPKTLQDVSRQKQTLN